MPGYVILSMGLMDVFGFRMISEPSVFNVTDGQAFLDEDFTTDVRMPAEQFLDSPATAAAPLFDHLRFGFDL